MHQSVSQPEPTNRIDFYCIQFLRVFTDGHSGRQGTQEAESILAGGVAAVLLVATARVLSADVSSKKQSAQIGS